MHSLPVLAARTRRGFILPIGLIVMKRLSALLQRLRRDERGSVFVEYLLLVTLIGIGVIAGLAAVRTALLNELADLVNAINAIN